MPSPHPLAIPSLLCALALGCTAPSEPPSGARDLPASFEAGLIFVEPITVQGHRLRFLTDSGGGFFIYGDQAAAAGLFDGEPPAAVEFPRWRETAWIPASQGGRLPVWNPPRRETGEPQVSGLLGAAWFAGGNWWIDYGDQRFAVLETWEPTAREVERAVPLHFKTDETGAPVTSFPRVQAVVDGVELPLLLDTGAQIRLSAGARAAFEDPSPAVRATSFIAASTFDRWRRDHPDWRVVAGADEAVDGAPMILIPSLRLGRCRIESVWFTRRPDESFTEYMSQWMDSPVVGALGGSALSAFTVILSYPERLMLLDPLGQRAAQPSATCGVG